MTNAEYIAHQFLLQTGIELSAAQIKILFTIADDTAFCAERNLQELHDDCMDREELVTTTPV